MGGVTIWNIVMYLSSSQTRALDLIPMLLVQQIFCHQIPLSVFTSSVVVFALFVFGPVVQVNEPCLNRRL